MERLTIKYCGEYVPKELCSVDRLGGADDCDLCCEYCKATEEGNEDCRECAINRCFNKLGEYEDTGITPEQIREIDRLYAEKCKELAECKENYLTGIELANIAVELKKLREYRDLDNQGKLLKLPCTVGNTVYEVQDLRKRIQQYTITDVHISRYGNMYEWELKDGKGLYSNVSGFSECALGDSVFLTMKEAESALKELETRKMEAKGLEPLASR